MINAADAGTYPLSLAVTVIVGLTAACFAWTSFRRRKQLLESKKPFDELPMPPNSHWFKGHRASMVGDFRDYLKRVMMDHSNEYGQIGIWFYSQPCLAVTNWKDARAVLCHESQRQRIKAFERHINMFLGPRNIGVLRGREWKYHRAVILRSFSPAAIEASKQTILDVTSTMIESLKARLVVSSSKGNVVQMPVASLMKMITVDIFGKVAFSRNLGCCKDLTPSPIAKAFDFLGDELTRRVRSPYMPANFLYCIPTPANLRHRKERKLLRSFLSNVIEERRASKEQKADLLSELLSSSSSMVDCEQDDPVEIVKLQDILLSVLFAGYDTTSITLTYALYLISQNPQVEENALREIEAACSRSSSLSLKDHQADELVYCRAVVLETLRLFPPAVLTVRCLERPIKLDGGFVASEGTYVIIPIWLIHRNEQAFPQPNDFRPDRWVKRGVGTTTQWVEREESDDESGSGSTIAAANRNGFLAFSAGARSCPGQKLAMQEAVLVLASLLKALRFRAVDENYELVPVRRGLIQCPRDGLPMIIESR